MGRPPVPTKPGIAFRCLLASPSQTIPTISEGWPSSIDARKNLTNQQQRCRLPPDSLLKQASEWAGLGRSPVRIINRRYWTRFKGTQTDTSNRMACSPWQNVGQLRPRRLQANFSTPPKAKKVSLPPSELTKLRRLVVLLQCFSNLGGQFRTLLARSTHAIAKMAIFLFFLQPKIISLFWGVFLCPRTQSWTLGL